MKLATYTKIQEYRQLLAAANGIDVESTRNTYNVEPTQAQKLVDKVQDSSSFLTKINMLTVVEQSGQKVLLGINGPIASTTDTKTKDREPKSLASLAGEQYACEKVNFDTAMPYELLDSWAKFPDFMQRLSNQITKQIRLDLIMMGFNGEKRSVSSDISTNKLLQDVKKGWLEKIRTEKTENSMTAIIDAKGATADSYYNYDAAVMDATNTLIAEHLQGDTELVVLVGRGIMHDKLFPLVNKEQPNSEKIAADMIISQKRIGGLQAVQVPFMPADTALITRLDNLSIYFQESGQRRSLLDNPKRDRLESFISQNIDYVIENYDGVALIKFKAPTE